MGCGDFRVGLGRIRVVSSSRLRCQELYTSDLGWIRSGWGGFEFQAEMSGTLHIRFLVKFGLWMFFKLD